MAVPFCSFYQNHPLRLAVPPGLKAVEVGAGGYLPACVVSAVPDGLVATVQ